MPETTPAPDAAPAFQTPADQVADLKRRFGGEFEREPTPDGHVFARMVWPSGETISARGDTTADAVARMAQRVIAFHAALPEG